MARLLGRAPSTVSREIKRNNGCDNRTFKHGAALV
jgi:IS30 family transposase